MRGSVPVEPSPCAHGRELLGLESQQAAGGQNPQAPITPVPPGTAWRLCPLDFRELGHEVMNILQHVAYVLKSHFLSTK